MATLTHTMPTKAETPTVSSEARIERGTAPVGKKMSEIFNKKGRWQNDAERLTADQIRKKAWQRNTER